MVGEESVTSIMKWSADPWDGGFFVELELHIF
jgi:hypothetical protein